MREEQNRRQERNLRQSKKKLAVTGSAMIIPSLFKDKKWK